MARRDDNSPGCSGRHRKPSLSSHTRSPRRHHRKKRFHVHPKAMGHGYEASMPVLDEPDVSPAATPEEEAAARVARVRQTARRGMLVCAGLFLLIWACIHFDWYFKIYMWLVNAWSNFAGSFVRH